MKPLLVVLMKNDVPVSVVELIDPRDDFCRLFNEEAEPGVRAVPVIPLPDQPTSSATRLASSSRLAV